jgi:hypothetical protein
LGRSGCSRIHIKAGIAALRVPEGPREAEPAPWTPRRSEENSLEAALDWAWLEGAATTEESVTRTGGAEPYIPYKQTLSLLQSAHDEFIDAAELQNWRSIQMIRVANDC